MLMSMGQSRSQLSLAPGRRHTLTPDGPDVTAPVRLVWVPRRDPSEPERLRVVAPKAWKIDPDLEDAPEIYQPQPGVITPEYLIEIVPKARAGSIVIRPALDKRSGRRPAIHVSLDFNADWMELRPVDAHAAGYAR